ncbi:MAG: alpha/beta hydrolase [Crocinitomicaceae bacterium]
MKSKIRIFLFIFFVTTFNLIGQRQRKEILKKVEPLSIGDRLIFDSDILKEDRIINVYLPHSYATDTAKNYPVIYLLDGSINKDFMHIVGIVQFGSYSWINFVPESIVVGIASIDRKKDFTFGKQKNGKRKKDSRRSSDFIKFIDNELIPVIDKRYRVESESTVIGQSLGGLLVSEILIKKPHIFDNYIIISPTLWWDNASLLHQEPVNCLSKKTIFIGVGIEGRVKEQSTKVMYQKFKDLNRPNFTVYYELFENLDNSNILHLAVYKAFNIIFKTRE